MEYLLAKAFLEGTGTAKDEKLGLLWMNKAAHDGSGDASTYPRRLAAEVILTDYKNVIKFQ